MLPRDELRSADDAIRRLSIYNVTRPAVCVSLRREATRFEVSYSDSLEGVTARNLQQWEHERPRSPSAPAVCVLVNCERTTTSTSLTHLLELVTAIHEYRCELRGQVVRVATGRSVRTPAIQRERGLLYAAGSPQAQTESGEAQGATGRYRHIAAFNTPITEVSGCVVTPAVSGSLEQREHAGRGTASASQLERTGRCEHEVRWSSGGNGVRIATCGSTEQRARGERARPSGTRGNSRLHTPGT